MAKYDYFISHSSNDKNIAFEIANAIEATGHSCWIAPRNIPSGIPYARAIMKGIEECDTFIVIITGYSIVSKDVLYEIDNAHSLKKTIIPIKFSDLTLSPELNYYLSQTQCLHLDIHNIGKIADLLELEPLISSAEFKLKNPEHTPKPASTAHKLRTTSPRSSLPENQEHEEERDTETSATTIAQRLKNLPSRVIESIKSISLGTIVYSILLLIMVSFTLWYPYVYVGLYSIFDTEDINTQIKIGDYLFDGKGLLSENPDQAFKWYEKAALRGNPSAQNRLGNCYYNGKGVDKDHTKAVEWYGKAAEQGNFYAQNSLGNCYYDGDGVNKDYSKAVEWYSKAAEQGYARAQSNLGACYYNGKGVDKDYAKAVEWYSKAVEQGNPSAQNLLGNCYYNGNGVDKDYTKAVELYSKAAEQGNSYAQNSLGNCYYNGNGVDKDYTKAVEWYTKAAEQGNPWGQKNLGTCYHYGNGVDQNYDSAYFWLKKAIDNGNESAAKEINTLPKEFRQPK